MTHVDINGVIFRGYENAQFVISEYNTVREHSFRMVTRQKNSGLRQLIENSTEFHVIMIDPDEMKVIGELKDATLMSYSFNGQKEDVAFTGTLVTQD
jgi:molybdate-binding protein